MGKLTTLAVRAATAPGRYVDGDGLSLVVKPGGTRSWVLRVQVAGRRRDFGCGSAERVTLKEAREKALGIRKEFEAGLDPVNEKKKRHSPPALTFAVAAGRLHAELKPSWREGKHRDDWLSSLEKHAYPKLGNVPVDAIDGPMIRDTLLPIWLEIPETARRVRQRIGAVLDWAHSNGLRPTEAPLRSVTKGLPSQRTKPRTHFAAMPYCNVPTFVADMRAASNTMGRMALEFAILTAARSGEVRGATWTEIDLEGARWTIPASRMKMKRPHAIPLSPRALEIVTGLHELRTGKFVFPGAGNRPLSDMTLTKVLRDAGLMTEEEEPRAITAHGFRSSFRDWAGEHTSFPGDVCEAALAHDVRNPTERAYHRTRYYDRRVALMEAWGQFVGKQFQLTQAVTR